MDDGSQSSLGTDDVLLRNTRAFEFPIIYRLDRFDLLLVVPLNKKKVDTRLYVVVVVVVVVFTLKTVLTSIQYPSLSYSRQRNEFSWSQANPK